MKKPTVIRLKIIENTSNTISYLEVCDSRVSYVSPSGVPLALSNIAGDNATELRWRLQDACSEDEAVTAARKYMQYAKQVEIFN